jgi:hypothetical protein
MPTARVLFLLSSLLCWYDYCFAQLTRPEIIVVAAQVPSYPSTAVAAGIEGTVISKIKVTDGEVLDAEIVSGPTILASAAKQNLLTWRFDSTVNETLRVMYVFELAKEEIFQPENPVIVLRLPNYVKLTANPVRAVTVRGSN